MVASSGINYFSSNRLTSIPVFLERERNVRMRQIIDIYGFQLPMTSFLAKIHTSNARRRIRETMSTEPRDSSKLISGGPRTVLLRHRARYKHTGTYMYIHAEKILTFSPARVCSPVLENLWFSLNGSFLLRFEKKAPPPEWKKMEKGTKKGGNIRKREGEGDVINRGSGIAEKEARAGEKEWVHIGTPIHYLETTFAWSGDRGSR